MQSTTILLFLGLLRLPAILAYSSGAPLSACIDSGSTDIYYRASTGHNSNQRSAKTAWIEVYAAEDINTKVSCVEQSKSYYGTWSNTHFRLVEIDATTTNNLKNSKNIEYTKHNCSKYLLNETKLNVYEI